MSNIINLFKISFLEYRKFLLKTSTYILSGIILLLCLLIIRGNMMFYVKGVKANANDISLTFNGLMQFVMMFQSAAMLTEEFRLGTIPFLFTSNKSRTQILFLKLLSFFMFCITICLIDFVIVAYYYYAKNIVINNNFFWWQIILYLLFTWFIGSYFLFFSVILKSRMNSFVSGMFFLFVIGDFTTELANKFPVLDKFLRFIPFADIFKFLYDTNINLNIEKIISMLAFGAIFFVLAAIIIERRDLV